MNEINLTVMRQRQWLVTFTKVKLSPIFECEIVIIFLSIKINTCFASHRDCSFEYPPHMFWLRNKKINFQVGILIWVPTFRKPEL